jgi:hypothetical protein
VLGGSKHKHKQAPINVHTFKRENHLVMYHEALLLVDFEAVKADLRAVFTDSKAWWPADYGNYAPFFVRLVSHERALQRVRVRACVLSRGSTPWSEEKQPVRTCAMCALTMTAKIKGSKFGSTIFLIWLFQFAKHDKWSYSPLCGLQSILTSAHTHTCARTRLHAPIYAHAHAPPAPHFPPPSQLPSPQMIYSYYRLYISEFGRGRPVCACDEDVACIQHRGPRG